MSKPGTRHGAVVADPAPPSSWSPNPRSASCSLTQTLDLIGERWMLMIMREAFAGTCRFSDFRCALSIAPDVLTARLTVLVDRGIMERRSYREPGQRARASYHLTAAGRELALVLGALQQWGDEHLPSDLPRLAFRSAAGRPVSVRFVDDQGVEVHQHDVAADRPDTTTG